ARRLLLRFEKSSNQLCRHLGRRFSRSQGDGHLRRVSPVEGRHVAAVAVTNLLRDIAFWSVSGSSCARPAPERGPGILGRPAPPRIGAAPFPIVLLSYHKHALGVLAFARAIPRAIFKAVPSLIARIPCRCGRRNEARASLRATASALNPNSLYSGR